MVDDDVARELDELKRAYRAALPSKVDALAKAIESEDRAGASALAHRLRGTSGSYGLEMVSARAGAIEDALEARAFEWAEVRAHLERLRQEVTR